MLLEAAQCLPVAPQPGLRNRASFQKTGSAPGEADLTISASAYDFVLLARRQEDPDSLFFSRRLAMEGDTELGLLVKNTIDAIELPVFSIAQFKPSQVLARLRARMSAH